MNENRKDNVFEIDKIWKTVNFSTKGRGLVGVYMFGHKSGDIKKGIIHSLGINNEGPRENRGILTLKQMRANYRRGGVLSLFHDDAFEFISFGSDKICCDKPTFKQNDISFIVDLDKNRDTGYFVYRWTWSKGDMFGPMNASKKYFTTQKISCKTKKLVYQLAVGRNVVMDGLPQLSIIDKAGKEAVLKKVIRRPEPLDMALTDSTEDCSLCDYYFVEIYEPEIGSTYKITWGIKTTKLDWERCTYSPIRYKI